MTVLCFVEHGPGGVDDPSLRALHLAGAVAEGALDDLAAVVVGDPGEGLVDILGAFGAGEVHALVSPALAPYGPLAWARAIAALRDSLGAASVVAPATDRGSELMAHVAAISGFPFVPGCLSVTRADGSGLRLERQRWGGSLVEEVVIESASYALGAAAVVPAEPSRQATTAALRRHETFDADAASLAVQVVSITEAAGGTDLASASVVIGGGRGVGDPGNFAPLEELAELLGGTVGVSRVVTSLGWRPHTQQVGQTGTRIAPELYLACGISGAIQHMAGCQTAKHLVAINTDPDAPIMSYAEYAVVGDLNEIVPALVAAIEARS